MRSALIVPLALATFGVSAAAAQACTDNWQGGSGSYNEASHWSAGYVPKGEPSESVCITESGSYTVTLGGHVDAQGGPGSITVGGSSGTQTFDEIGESWFGYNNETSNSTTLGAKEKISFGPHTKLILDTTGGGTRYQSGESLGASADIETPTFEDSGEILVENSDPQWPTNFYVFAWNLNSGSSLDVESGKAIVADQYTWAGTNKGTITVHSGASLELTPGGTGAHATLTNEGPVSNQGTIKVYEGEWIQKGGALTGNPVVVEGGGSAATLDDSAGTGAFELPKGDNLIGTIPPGQTVTATDRILNEITGLGLGEKTLINEGKLVFEGPGEASSEGQLEVGHGGIANKGVIDASSGNKRRVDLGIGIQNEPGGVLDVTGGRLEFDGYSSMKNRGLIKIAPGAVFGMTQGAPVTNEAAGTISPEIASATSFGKVDLASACCAGGSKFNAGGTVAPVLTGGFTPAKGAEFDVFELNGGSFEGTFASVANGFSADYAHKEARYVGVVYGGSASSGGSPTTGTKAPPPSGPIVIERIKATSHGVEVTIKASKSGTVTISGSGLDRTVVKVKAGTHKIKVGFSRSGHGEWSHHKTIKVQASLKVGKTSHGASKSVKL
jgi:hypothetical protein